MPRFLDQADRGVGKRGFTLIELLTACAVLALLTVILVTMADQGGRLWAITESQNQYRQRARALLEFMAEELRQAVIPIDGSQADLQMVINPPGASDFPWHDTIFWQAPIATDTVSGDLAEIGYFVRWTDNQANLCRFFVNPSDANYLVRTDPNAWVTKDLLNAVAPVINKQNGPPKVEGDYRGLYLENVVGMWIVPFNADDDPSVSSTYTTGDSRQSGLPAFVEISLVMINNATAKRITSVDAGIVQSLCASSATAESFVAQSGLPAYIRNNCSVLTTTVNLANAK